MDILNLSVVFCNLMSFMLCRCFYCSDSPRRGKVTRPKTCVGVGSSLVWPCGAPEDPLFSPLGTSFSLSHSLCLPCIAIWRAPRFRGMRRKASQALSSVPFASVGPPRTFVALGASFPPFSGGISIPPCVRPTDVTRQNRINFCDSRAKG
ncbi:hypothetical protein BD309DRAFT_394034 [Dichomitus squalens]|nr:hypothetical protein BD309DRAFT_394034 [Dichomitus squalens]